MMTDEQILEVVSAHKEGKEIEWRDRRHAVCEWHNLRRSTSGGWFGWDFQNLEYRVVPEPRKPREWIVVEGHDALWFPRACVGQLNPIHVREVIE